MHCDEEISLILRWKLLRGIKGKTQSSRVSREGYDRRLRFVADFRRAEIRIRDAVGDAVRPAVVFALPDDVDLVRRRVVAEPVPAVVGAPEFFRHRVPRDPDRVSKSAGENILAAAVGIISDDGRAPAVFLFAHVARRAHGDVELPVGAEQDRSGPMALRWAGQIGHDHRRLSGSFPSARTVDAPDLFRSRGVEFALPEGAS